MLYCPNRIAFEIEKLGSVLSIHFFELFPITKVHLSHSGILQFQAKNKQVDYFLFHKLQIQNIVNKAIESSTSIFKNGTNLKKAILQLAVMGKLVPQNPNDQPASERLKEIVIEKVRLIKEGKIRNRESVPFIKKDEIPYSIPKNWSWVRFSNITKVITCGVASTPKFVKEGMPFLSAKNIKPFRFIPENHKFVSIEAYKKITQNAKPELNDILLTRVGAGIGESAIIDKEVDCAYYVSLTLIKPYLNFLSSRYLVYFLNSPIGIAASLSNILGKGASQGNLNVNLVRNFPIPLPPLPEQKRIVEKIDQLMSLCDKLENDILISANKKTEIFTSILGLV